MGNQTTPIKGAFIALVSAKLAAMLGFDPGSATVVATAVWLVISAAIAYVVPHDIETKIGSALGLVEKP